MSDSEQFSGLYINNIEQYGPGDWAEDSFSTADTEQEDVWDWVKGIGSGAAQGAATGAAAGPWGALIGGLGGAGLGAIQTASQQQKPGSPAAPPQGPQAQVTASQPLLPAQSISPPAAPVSPSTAPPSAGQMPVGNVSGVSPQLIQQLLQLLPLLTQLLARPSGANAAGGARAESEASQDNGDYVPDDAFTAGEGTHQSGARATSESHKMAEGGMAREEESVWDWIVEAGNGTHNAEWTQEGSIEVVPAWNG